MRRSGSISAFAILLGACVALASCGTRLGTPQSSMSEAEAEENLAGRLERTQVVRKQLRQLRDAFARAQDVLKVLAPVLGKAPEKVLPEALAPFVNHFPAIFSAFGGGLVQSEIDGTWALEVPIVAGASFGDLTQCPMPRARVSGRQVVDQQDVALYLSDCSGQNWDRLAKWVVHPDGGIEMTYWPLVGANLRPIEGAPVESGTAISGPCNFQLSPAQHSIFVGCQLPPISGVPEGASLQAGSFELRDVPNGTAATLALVIGKKGELMVDLAPGMSPKLTFCKVGGVSCSAL